MTHEQFIIRQCSNVHCRFRFPVQVGEALSDYCPKCGHRLILASPPYSNTDLSMSQTIPNSFDCSVLLDNIRSAMNVGSIIRSCDCTGVHQLYLCGITPTPDNSKVRKTSLEAESTLSWSYHRNALDIVAQIKNEGCLIWALETAPNAVPLDEALIEPLKGPLLIICGNERSGVDPEILSICDRIVFLPLLGIKSSMNVAVAVGAALVMLQSASWV